MYSRLVHPSFSRLVLAISFVMLSGCGYKTTVYDPLAAKRTIGSVGGGSSNGVTTPSQEGPVRVEDTQMRDSPEIQRATMRPYQVHGKWYYPSHVDVGQRSHGIASWYGPTFHGKKTSNGEIYSMYARTAAHKTYPMNTIVKVVNQENGKSTVVRINDRGPFVEGRVIDLSNTAAREIDMTAKGLAPVELEVLGFGGVVDDNLSAEVPTAVAESHEFKVGVSAESVQVTRFLIQLGSFRSKEGAEASRAQHQGRGGYQAVVRDYELDGKPLYRVFLSGFKSEEEARDFISKDKGLGNAFIMTE